MNMAPISNCLLACVIFFLIQNIAARSLGEKCDYVCKEKDLDTEDGYFASGSAISSQFLLPDGSVVTNSKETAISSDGVKHTFHELKKEADRFVQTGTGGSVIHPAPHFPNIPAPHIPKLIGIPAVPVPYYSSGSSGSHSSYSESTKEHELQNKVIGSLRPSVSSHYDQFQAQNTLNSQSQFPCNVGCAQISGQSEGSYGTVVANAPSVSSSSYQKYESSSQTKNSTQTQPILFSNLKPNVFTTNVVDFNNNGNHVKTDDYEGHVKPIADVPLNLIQHGEQKAASSHHIEYTGGPTSHLNKVVVQVGGPAAVSSQSYQKQESSSHVESAAQPVPLSAVYVQQAGEAELSKNQASGFRSPVLLGGVPQNVPLEHQAGSYHHSSGHSYYSSSSSSSKTENAADGSQIISHSKPQSYSSSSGYSSSGGSSVNPPEYYYNGNKINKVSSSIFDQAQSNSNAETICATCTYVPAGAPVRNSYGIATSFSSHSNTVNGKTTENREAAVAVNDNGKVDSYHVKS